MKLARETIEVMTLVIKNLEAKKKNLENACSPELYATDLALKLVKKGKNWREAYQEIKEKIKRALDGLIKQGCKLTCTFVDAYDAVGHKAIDAANEVKLEYKDKITLLTITQPLGGLVDDKARALYEEITAKADIAGGLPSKDRPDDEKSLDHLFEIAKK